MERIRSVFIILMALCALLLLGSCDGFYTEDEQGETGSFTIDLWGTGRSVAFPPEDILPLGSGDPDGPSLAELKFEVIFTELESSTERSFTFMGNEDSRGTIAVGTYFVKMEVRFLNDNHYAWGIPEDNPITITSGLNQIYVRVYNPNTAMPPVIHTEPEDAIYYFFNGASLPGTALQALSVAAQSIDGGELSYQWFSSDSATNNVPGVSGVELIPGAGDRIYEPDIDLVDEKTYYYFVVVTNTNSTLAPGNQQTGRSSRVVTIRVADAPVVMQKDADPELGYANLRAALTTIGTAAGTYTVKIKDNQELSPFAFTAHASNVRNITLVAEPTTAVRTVQLSENGRLFTLPNNLTLTLDEGITLRGRNIFDHGADNNDSVIQVNSGGTLIMNPGSVISGNTTNSGGGGVYVTNNARFTMIDGEISGNIARTRGGGVYVTGANAIFTMEGGTISDNMTSNAAPGHGDGGGVFVTNGTFTMTGGTISKNKASGGGVYVTTGATFNMTDGLISENESVNSGGGGVYVVSGARFFMDGGIISGNKARTRGAGVYVSEPCTFTKTAGVGAGIITGFGDPEANLVTEGGGNNLGHAVYVNASTKRETTVEDAQELRWNGTTSPPQKDGAWTDGP